MSDYLDDLVLLGKIGPPYGVRGWFRVRSYTEPMENLLDYSHWLLRRNGRLEQFTPDGAKQHGKHLIAHVPGVETPEAARQFLDAEVLVAAEQMPVLADGEYYWHQLQGLKVYAVTEGGDEVALGEIAAMMATGANDVMVVAGERDAKPIEWLIPWLPDQVVIEVDLETRRIVVDWDPNF